MIAGILFAGVSIGAPVDGGCPAGAAPASVRSSSVLETAASAGQFETLVKAVKAAGLEKALSGEGPFTVFAPTDEAFAALPEGTLASLLEPAQRADLRAILEYHVVAGDLRAASVVEATGLATLAGQRLDVRVEEGEVRVDDARVVKTDIACTNGVIHVIDAVVLPSREDIVATAMADDRFETLVAALKAAGLVEALQGEGPFTVFAPTDEAFARLPEGALENLLEPENRDRLAAVLKYHVVSGRVYSDGAASVREASTLQGSALPIEASGARLKIGQATVKIADLDATNGVIHVIDRVLLPE